MLIFNILSLPEFIGLILGILLALAVHESAHAITANYLGDPTAKYAGRISLNPFAHLDLLGTVMLFLVGFGWGKPVPINPNNLKSKWDEIKIAFAGPLSNLLLAVILALFINFLPLPDLIKIILFIAMQINLIFMIFNLLPIPPLDGSSILKVLLSEHSYNTLQSLSTPLFLAFLFFLYATPVMRNFLGNVVSIFTHILIK